MDLFAEQQWRQRHREQTQDKGRGEEGAGEINGESGTPVFLPEESHGQRSLAGCDPWGHEESDMTEVTEHTHACTPHLAKPRPRKEVGKGPISKQI